MVVEFADPPTMASTFEQRENLRLTLTPPKGWMVLLGSFSGVLWKIGFNHFGWATDFQSPRQIDAQSTAWVMGPLYLQTASGMVEIEAKAFAVKHSLSAIWPDDHSALARPATVLDDIDSDRASRDLLPDGIERRHIRRAWETIG
jgi:hypothetical protein